MFHICVMNRIKRKGGEKIKVVFITELKHTEKTGKEGKTRKLNSFKN